MEELSTEITHHSDAKLAKRQQEDEASTEKPSPRRLVFSPCLTPLPDVDDDASAFSSFSLDDSAEIYGLDDQEDSFLMGIGDEDEVVLADVTDGRPLYHFHGVDDNGITHSLHDCFLSADTTHETLHDSDIPEPEGISNENENRPKREPAVQKTSRAPKHQKRRHNSSQSKSIEDGKPSPDRKPKRPLSAYNIFFRVKRAELVSDSTTKLSFASIGKVIGKAWKSISPEELRKYELVSAKDMIRYRKQITSWRKLRRMRLRGEDCQTAENKAANYLHEPTNTASPPSQEQQGHQVSTRQELSLPFSLIRTDSSEQTDLPSPISLIRTVSTEPSQPPRPIAESPSPPTIANFVSYYDYTPPGTPLRRLSIPVSAPHITTPPRTYRRVSPCHSSRTPPPPLAAPSPLVHNGAPRRIPHHHDGIVRNWDSTRILPPPPAPPLIVSAPRNYYVEPYPPNNKGTRVAAAMVPTSQPYYYSQPPVAHYPPNPPPGTSTIHLPPPYLDAEQRGNYTVSYTCVRMRQSQVQGYIARYYGGGGGGEVMAKPVESKQA